MSIPSTPAPAASPGPFPFDSLPDAVMLLKPDGTLLGANRATAKRLGRTLEEIVGQNMYSLLPPEVAASRRRQVEEVARTGQPVHFEDVRDGRTLDNHVFPLRDSSGDITQVFVLGRDVSSQRQTENALRTYLALLDNVQELTHFAGWECNVREQTVYWTEELYRLHGFSRSDFGPGSPQHVEKSLACYDPQDRPRIIAAFEACCSQGTPFDFEVPFTNAQGRRFWIRTGAQAVRANDGSVDKVVGYFADVSSQRASMQALRESEEKFRTLVDDAAEMLFFHDDEGRIVEVNRASVESTGYSRDELLRLHVWDLDPGVDPARRTSQTWRELSPGARIEFDAVHRRKDGSCYPVEIRLAVVGLCGKKFFVALANDVSARRAAESALRERERQLATLLSNLPGIVYRCKYDADWTMEFISDGTAELLGRPPDAFLPGGGATYESAIHPDDRQLVREGIRDALSRNVPFTLEYRVVDAAGQTKWVWERGRMVRAANGEPHLEGFVQDVTARKLFEVAREEKARLEKQLAHVEKLQSLHRMAGSVAHHFNNQLQAVIGSLELVAFMEPDAQTIRESILNALGSARTASNLGKLMLMYVGQTFDRPVPLDLAKACRISADSLIQRRPEGVAFSCDVPQVDVRVLANLDKIDLIVSNLVDNAFEASASGEVRLRLLVADPARIPADARFPEDWIPPESPHAVVEVSDQCSGISPEQLHMLGDPFFTTKFVGRGMGLPAVIGLLRVYGGGLVVRSRPGEGSTFCACFPLAPCSNGVSDDPPPRQDAR